MIRADIPETYKVPLGGNSSNQVMSTVQATKGPFTSLYPPPASPSFVAHPLTPVFTPTMANTSRPPSPWHLPPPPPPTPVSGPGPGQHPFLQEYQMLLLNNINRLQQQQQQQLQHQEDHLMPNSNTAQSISPCLSQGEISEILFKSNQILTFSWFDVSVLLIIVSRQSALRPW